jgi:hypothetical protein
MAQLNFDARQVKPDEGRVGPIPAGWYLMAITESENKPVNNSQTGAMYLATTFTVLEGQYAGRKVFFNFNLRNDNPKTQEIAYGQLSAVCHATGRLTVGDSVELHNLPMKVRVKIRPEQKDDSGNVKYEASNDLSAFKQANDPSAVDAPSAAPKGPSAGPAQPAFAPPPAPQAAPAWQPPAAQQAPQQAPAPAWQPPAQQQFQQPQQAPQQAAPAPAWQPPAQQQFQAPQQQAPQQFQAPQGAPAPAAPPAWAGQ